MIRRVVVTCLTLLASACLSHQAAMEALPRAVGTYHDLLRWKNVDGAARFRLEENRPEFLERYVAVEDDLKIDSIEVRSVVWQPVVEEEPLVAIVTVVAHAYLLPSTVLEKVIMQQRWEYRDAAWVLVTTSRELVPPVDPVATDPQNLPGAAAAPLPTDADTTEEIPTP